MDGSFIIKLLFAMSSVVKSKIVKMFVIAVRNDDNIPTLAFDNKFFMKWSSGQ